MDFSRPACNIAHQLNRPAPTALERIAESGAREPTCSLICVPLRNR
ncbi:hypothetical protein C7S16_0040 [Burkholderia thailandensis]|uniref:Uncharacterized protein n=1 Tax=Burkholderia thailandensis TaxID=57975 RepID=A0AAW9D1J8_BURTH|nr:hypothetical protein [Burkholderia thailandensis]